jgi:ribonuclease HI
VKAEERELVADAQVYMDGSIKDGWVGVAVVLVRNGELDKVLKVQLGRDTKHKVYEAELVGLQLALHLIQDTGWIDSVAIFTDNQAVLKALQAGRTERLQNLFADLDLLLGKVLRVHRGLQIDTRWIPGHKNVEGNKKADQAVKEAGDGSVSPQDRLPPHLQGTILINPTSAQHVHKQNMERTWATLLEAQP